MKIQIIIIVIACVIASTVSNNNNNEVHHSKVKKIGHFRHHHENVKNREKIRYRNNENPDGLEFYYSENNTLIGFLNGTSHVGAIFSYSSKIVIIVDGQNGNAIAIDINSKTLIKLSKLWDSAGQNFGSFFQSLSNLQTLIHKGQADNNLHQQLIQLCLKLKIDPGSLVIVSKILNELLPTTLKGLIKGEGHFHIRGSIVRFATILKGLADLFGGVPGGFTVILKNGTTLDLSSIVNAPNGIQALLRVLQALAPHLNLSNSLGKVLNNIENLLKIMVELGGNDPDNGPDNVLRIIYNVILLKEGRGSLDVFIHILLEIGQNGGVEINGADITPIIDDLLKLSEKQNSGAFNVLIKFLRDLNENNLMLNDINISRLLLLLRRGNFRGAIDLVVHVFVHLNNIINPAQSVPRFFSYLLNLFSNARGNHSISHIIPGLDPNQIANFNATQIFQNKNALDNIAQIPVAGQIYQLISTALKTATNGAMNFANLLSNGVLSSFLNQFVNPGVMPNPVNTFGGLFGGLSWLNPLNNLGNLQNLTSGLGQLNPVFVNNSGVTPSTSNETGATTQPTIITTLSPEPPVFPENSQEKKHLGHSHKGKFRNAVKASGARNHHFHAKKHDKNGKHGDCNHENDHHEERNFLKISDIFK